MLGRPCRGNNARLETKLRTLTCPIVHGRKGERAILAARLYNSARKCNTHTHFHPPSVRRALCCWQDLRTTVAESVIRAHALQAKRTLSGMGMSLWAAVVVVPRYGAKDVHVLALSRPFSL